jgi:hypothetical protein
MSKYLLVSYNDNWADELCIGGSLLIEQEEWINLVTRVKAYFDAGNPLSNYFSTNEEIKYSSFEDWYYKYNIIELNDVQVTVLKELLENREYKNSCECQFYYPEPIIDGEW